jgi:DNA polymerase phi
MKVRKSSSRKLAILEVAPFFLFTKHTGHSKMGDKRKRLAQDASSAGRAAKKKKRKGLPENTDSHSKAADTPLDSSSFQDHPRGLLSQRETELYDILSSEDTAERLNAANAIVTGLLGGSGVQESTLQRHLERNLFRGLASGRKAARIGRGIVLTEILRQLFGAEKLAEEKYPGLTFDKVLGFLLVKTKPIGDLSGQEEKDHALGLLFGLQSFVRAKILCDKDNNWPVILEKLMELAKKKPWIREECGWVIMEALAQMRQSQAEHTLQVLYDAGLASTPEGVGIFITAKDRFPLLKVPIKPWGPTGNPLDRLQSLAKALKESSHDDGSKTQEAKLTGNWNPKLHFVWDIVLVQFAHTKRGRGDGRMPDFENFWKVAVDGRYLYAILWISIANDLQKTYFLLRHPASVNTGVFYSFRKYCKILIHILSCFPVSSAITLFAALSIKCSNRIDSYTVQRGSL